MTVKMAAAVITLHLGKKETRFPSYNILGKDKPVH